MNDDTAHRHHFHANGYQPIPVRGKIPHISGWQQLGSATPEQITAWEHEFPDHTNTSILTKFTPCLDIDVLNDTIADAVVEFVRGWIGERGQVVRRVGLAPKVAIFFHTNEPFSKLTLPFTDADGASHKIELLGDGQQVVVKGIHPDTKQPYDYPEGVDLLDIVREQLPPITESNARRLLTEIGKMLIKSYHCQVGSSSYRSAPTNSGNGGEPQFDFSQRQFDRDACEIEIIDGRNLHDNCRDLAASLARSGCSEQQIIDRLRSLLMLCRPKVDGKRWQERWDYVPELARSAVRKFPPLGDTRARDEQSDTATPPIPYLNLRAWDNAPPAPIAYIVKDRIPARQVCLFTGHGASGKSTIALNLCCATVLGRDWLKSMPDFGPCLFIDAEDDEQVLHHRLYANALHYGVTFEQLASDGLHVAAMAGRDVVMATADRGGKVMPTRFYNSVLEQAGDIKPKIIVLASLANMFAGEENSRSQAQQFISLLTRIAIVGGSGLVPIAHPSVRGIETKTGISGSTAWFNSVRAQMYLRTIEDKDEEQPSSDLRVLEFLKNQYGKLHETLTVQYRQPGLFLPVSSATVEQLAREHRVDEVFLTLMRRFTTQHRPVSPTPRSGSYAPDQFIKEAEATGAQVTRKEAEAAMRRLLKSGAVLIKNFGKPSNPKPFLVLPSPPTTEGDGG